MKNHKTIEMLGLFMEQKDYSKSTIDNYLSCLKEASIYFDTDFSKVYNDMLRDYILLSKFNPSKSDQVISSLCLFYKTIYKKEINIKDLRPKKRQTIPDILPVKELQESIDSIRNIKHKAITMILYRCGLRVSELINLKISDIIEKDNKYYFHLKNTKNRTERLILIEDKLKDLIKKYHIEYKPKVYLFNGSGNMRYSASSIRSFLRKANSKLHPHKLRHQIITEKVDNGNNLLNVMNFSGHKSVKSTERYYHYSNAPSECPISY